MRRTAVVVLSAFTLAVGLNATAQQPQTVSPKLRSVLDSMKAYAENRNNVNKTPQGTFYFKWLMSPPPGFERAYFKLGELNKGTKFLSLALVKKTPGGVELIVLNDVDMNGGAEEAYQASGRNLQDADKAIAMAPDRSKVAVTPQMAHDWTSMIDELKWELKEKE
jgi:hypothetical protein